MDVFGSDSSDDEHNIELSAPKQVQDLLKERPKACGVLRFYALFHVYVLVCTDSLLYRPHTQTNHMFVSPQSSPFILLHFNVKNIDWVKILTYYPR